MEWYFRFFEKRLAEKRLNSSVYCKELGKSMNKNTIFINVEGIVYEIDFTLITTDKIFYNRLCKETHNYYKAFCKLVERMIRRHLKKINVDDSKLIITEENYKDSLKCFLNQDELLESYYLDEKNENIYYNFYLALKKVEFSQLLPFSEELKQISDQLEEIFKPINEITKPLQKILNDFSYQISQVFDKNGNGLWKQRKDNLLIYANYGWVIFMEETIGYLDHIPHSLDEADELGSRYVKDLDIDNLFKEILFFSEHENDVREAISCYRIGLYKSCVMILLPILDYLQSNFCVDHKPERLMVKLEKRNYKKPIGKEALSGVREIVNNSIDEKFYFSLCVWSSILKVLERLFDNGNDFLIEPEIINRNFLMHGYSHRNIRKIDCIKIFLLLNLFIKEIKKLETK